MSQLPMSQARIVYFSSVSQNTHRFVQKLDLPARRIGLRRSDPHVQADVPYVLITPTYGHGTPAGAVPKQVIKFLNDPANRALCRGVIAAGNTNFGSGYCIAGDIIAAKVGVPFLYRFELLGTPVDVARVRDGLAEFWRNADSRVTEPAPLSEPAPLCEAAPVMACPESALPRSCTGLR
ncbi:class Ib ribonucleoside-diphosphate reductase assembly flavoprotein NrdI [Pseudactinotalea sp. HY160]|nr:class Ib ribonucleoside-diphosphate reductase assembly flavoprotein NrdI [Pseudactinotalea sp. HY160]